ncbi:MAG: AbrB/MazE/SpoVT family DNA-binding domain-containing protein [Gemmatimonadota bacterium]|jgi:AbrB family looped-hinge helix DNA binding protein
MPSTVKLSSKHQIVVPREAREALGLRPGDRLVVNVRDDGVVEMSRRPDDPVAELEGILLLVTTSEDEHLLWPEAHCE